MKLIFKYSLLFVVCFAVTVFSLQAQSPRQEYFDSKINERKFDEKKWEELVKDFDYSEKLFEDYDEEFDTSQTNQNANTISPSDNSRNSSSAFWAGFFQILFIVVVVLVIVAVLINMLGAGNIFAPRSRKFSTNDTNFSIEKIENNIHETDLERYIREAVREGNYAIAIRLYYLAIIKELSLSKMIKWKRDKTNRTYLSEIRSTNLFQPFREVTRIFERVWYGEGQIGENEYLSIKPKFEQLIKAAQAKAASLKPD